MSTNSDNEPVIGAKGAEKNASQKAFHDAATKIFELSQLMQAYFAEQNTGMIDVKLMAATRLLIADLLKSHDGECFPQEMAAVQTLDDILQSRQKRDAQMRKEAEFLAMELGTICWKLIRKTREEDDVRRGLAGISKKISELIEEPGESKS